MKLRRVSTAENKGQYKIRTFENGDQTAAVKLFEKTYANYGGRTRGTPESWMWRCANRPDVDKDGIFIVTSTADNIVGYVVVGKSGNLWEIAYDPIEDGDQIASLLLEKGAAYLDSVGASSISVNAPMGDRPLREACKKQGFAFGPTPQMFLSVLNLEELVAALAKDHEEELRARFNEALLLKTKDAPFWIKDAVTLRIDAKGVRVEVDSDNPTITVETDYFTISSLLFRDISPLKAQFQAKLKIKPLSKVPTALKLLSNLQVKPSWSFQLSEYG